MRYIHTYNESKDNSINSILQQLGKLDVSKLKELLKPFNNQISRLREKYSINGIIDESLIKKDIGINESKNSIFDRLLSLFKFPVDVITSILGFFGDIITKLVRKFWSWTTILVAIVIFILGACVYAEIEHAMNGISIGIVNTNVEFVPEHVEVTTHTYTDSQGKTQTYTTTETIPDTWNMDVRASNGRIESWTTTDKPTGSSTKKEDIVRSDGKWQWVGTKKYGAKMGGGFSGGGAGGSY